MLFERKNISPLENEKQVNEVLEEVVDTVGDVKEVAVDVHEEVAEKVDVTPTEEVVEDVVNDPVEDVVEAKEAESVVTPTPKSALEEKYAIPEFEPKQGAAYFKRVVKPDIQVKLNDDIVKETKIDAKDVKSIECVDEVPDDVEVLDGVELVGELDESVEVKINDGVSVSLDDFPTEPLKSPDTVEKEVVAEKVVEEGKEDKVEEKEVDVPDDEPSFIISDELANADEVTNKPKKEESEDFKKTWEKFVDNVIIPTLVSGLDRLKDYVKTDVAEDLKKCSPEVK